MKIRTAILGYGRSGSGLHAGPVETIEETVEEAVYGDQNQIYAEIAAAIRGEKPFPVTPSDALELTRTLDAIRISDAENRVVTLE